MKEMNIIIEQIQPDASLVDPNFEPSNEEGEGIGELKDNGGE